MRPILDAPEGLVVAAGFYGRGVMTAPVAATAVESLVREMEAPFPPDPFRLDQFESPSQDFEFVSISAGTKHTMKPNRHSQNKLLCGKFLDAVKRILKGTIWIRTMILFIT